MNSLKSVFPIILIVCSFLSGCQKESLGENKFISFSNPPNVTINVQGRVTDEAGKPVQGAQVFGINKSAITNINGEFKMNNVSAYDHAAFVQISKNGYFTGSRTFLAREGQTHYIEVELLNKTFAGSINASTGGTVTLSNGASITLPASGVVTRLGNNAYSGIVNIAVKWIDPTSEALPRQMPGDLRGINETNNEVGLQSFGMLAVELVGSTGQALQIASGKKASLKFPLPTSILTSAPATVPLWSFNDTTGLWKYEGSATKVGNHYEAEVSHFSFWNCDAPFPVVNLNVTVIDQTGNPLKQAFVQIKRTIASSSSYGHTDYFGAIYGMVPKNEPLVLEVYAPYSSCGNIIYSKNIGPYSTATSITVNVNFTPAQSSTVTGRVNSCAGSPVTNGWVELILNSNVYRTLVTNGSFTLDIPVCGNSQTATILAADNVTNQHGLPTSITLNTGANNAGTITACGLAINEFINYTLGPMATNMAPPDSLTAHTTNGSGITVVSGRSSVSGTFKQITFSFTATSIGNVPLAGLTILENNTVTNLNPSSPIAVTLTEYGSAPGTYVAGSFSGMASNGLSVNIPIQGSFRVRKQQ